MNKMNNQREFSRVDVPVRVEIERQGQDIFIAVAHDVSLNGLRIQSDEHFEADCMCDVKVVLGGQGGEPIVIEAHGCVVRSDGQFIAIHFDNLDLEGYSHLKNLILYNSLDTDQVEREFDAHIGLHRKNN